MVSGYVNVPVKNQETVFLWTTSTNVIDVMKINGTPKKISSVLVC